MTITKQHKLFNKKYNLNISYTHYWNHNSILGETDDEIYKDYIKTKTHISYRKQHKVFVKKYKKILYQTYLNHRKKGETDKEIAKLKITHGGYRYGIKGGKKK